VVVEWAGGRATVIGLRRHGGLAWKRTLAAGVTPVTCSGCPRLVAGTQNGQVLVMDGTHVTTLRRPNEPIDETGGPTGFGPDASRVLWATRPDGKVRLRLLAGDPAVALGRAGILLSLSEDQEIDSYVAVSADGRRALAVSNADVVHPGQLQVLQVQDSRVVAVADLPVTLTDLDDDAATSGCIADDGSSSAVLLPEGKHLSLRQLRWGGRAGGGLTLPLRDDPNGLVPHCQFTKHGIVVYGQDSKDESLIDIARITAHKPPKISRVSAGDAGDAGDISVCPDSTVVMQLDAGIAVARPGQPVQRYAGSDGGCTSKGTVWILGKRSVSWIRSTNQGKGK